jgi:hypothetical protein
VLNFGVGAYNLRNYEAVLRKRAMQYDPDLIIIGFYGGDDFLLPPRIHLEGKMKLRPPLEMFYTSHLIKVLKKPPVKYDRKGDNLPLPTQNQIAYMDEHFLAILKNGKSKGIPVLLAYYSLIITPEVTDFMEKFTRERGIMFVNACKSMENVPLEDQVIHPLDNHPNAMVHQVYADNIYEYLKVSGLLE